MVVAYILPNDEVRGFLWLVDGWKTNDNDCARPSSTD